MVHQSRRRYLASIAGAGTAALAGCSGLLGDGGGGGGGDFESNAEFVPASMTDQGSTFEVAHLDVQRFLDEFPEDATSSLGLEEFESEIGISGDDIDALLQIELGPITDHTVLTGSFGTDDVLESMGLDEGTDTYEGYDTVMGQLAVDDGVLIVSTEYQAIIDAKAGDADNVLEADGEWGPAVENAASGTLSGVESADEGDPWEVTGIEMNARGESEMELVGYAHFESESAAQDNTDAVEQGIQDSAEDLQDITIEDVRVEGNVVVVEAVAAEYDI